MHIEQRTAPFVEYLFLICEVVPCTTAQFILTTFFGEKGNFVSKGAKTASFVIFLEVHSQHC